MIAVVGVPAWRTIEPAGPAGRACKVAIEAARHGARVELVGRTGDDAAGDLLMLALVRAGVGHAAVLRDPARGTPILDPGPPDELRSAAALPSLDVPSGPGAALPHGAQPDAADVAGAPDADDASRAPLLEPADVELGLRYLTAFGVLVATDELPAAALPAVIEAATYAGAHLVLLLPAGASPPASMPADSTALGVPEGIDDGAFATLVGAYAAALDAGRQPAAAFSAATEEVGWEALAR